MFIIFIIIKNYARCPKPAQSHINLGLGIFSTAYHLLIPYHGKILPGIYDLSTDMKALIILTFKKAPDRHWHASLARNIPFIPIPVLAQLIICAVFIRVLGIILYGICKDLLFGGACPRHIDTHCRNHCPLNALWVVMGAFCRFGCPFRYLLFRLKMLTDI